MTLVAIVVSSRRLFAFLEQVRQALVNSARGSSPTAPKSRLVPAH
jgi:hypothetical protein